MGSLSHLLTTKIIICPHSQCEKRLTSAKYWNNGKTPHQQPRLIHDISDIVFLVSAVYVCDNGHKTLAHDPYILKAMPHSSITFVLLHQTGFTRAFVDLCSSLCYNGMNFNSLEGTIKKLRWENFIQKKSMYEYLVRSLEVDSTHCDLLALEFSEFQNTAMAILPSDDTIGKCFLSNFLESENTYVSCSQSINTGCSLSFDHTFKIASNIGYARKDGKWVSQYDSAFFIMNSDGKIVSWQFTKGTSFKQIKTLLTSVNMRAMQLTKGTLLKQFTLITVVSGEECFKMCLEKKFK